MRTTARKTLCKDLEKARNLLTFDEQQALHARLATLNSFQAEAFLVRVFRIPAFRILAAKTAQEREAVIRDFEITDRAGLFYAAAAWAARTLALMEFLDPFMPDMPAKWASASALRLVEDFEGSEAWLWPYESERPWQEDDDDLEDD
jgi:hypothetical protein